jgi:hypothetical protein
MFRKTSQKKRKTFDMTKARVKGTEAAAFVKSQAQLKAQESKVLPVDAYRRLSLYRLCQLSPLDSSIYNDYVQIRITVPLFAIRWLSLF